MSNASSLDPQVQEAINAALKNNWEKALQLNRELAKKYPDDTETMNRLARSLSETGKINEAKKVYRKVLKVDPYNQISEKNLKRISSIKKGDLKTNRLSSSLKGDIFLEESGKTVSAILEDTAMPSVLAGLRTGDKIDLVAQRSNVKVVTSTGQRIGKIEDSLAQVISKNVRVGSKFEAFVKSVLLEKSSQKEGGSKVFIFIRENYRSPKVTTPPFPATDSSFTPYVREEALNLISNQAPLPTEADDTIEEVEVSQLPSIEKEESLEELAEKEHEENEASDEDQD
jgi:tetratricopeptide (TPR) repeat protein